MFPDLPLLLVAWVAGYITGCSCMFMISPTTLWSRRRGTVRDRPAALLPEPPAPDDGGNPDIMGRLDTPS